jgi:hypothetical protein
MAPDAAVRDHPRRRGNNPHSLFETAPARVRHTVEYRFDYEVGGHRTVSRPAFFGGSLTIGTNPGTPVTRDYAPAR